MTDREAMEQAFNFPHELPREVVRGEVTNPLGLNSWPIKEESE